LDLKLELTKRKSTSSEEELGEQLEKLWMKMGTDKAIRMSLEEQLHTEEKFRKFVEWQLKEKDKKIISLEKQLKEVKEAKNQAEQERE
jgi:hypothetical protein